MTSKREINLRSGIRMVESQLREDASEDGHEDDAGGASSNMDAVSVRSTRARSTVSSKASSSHSKRTAIQFTADEQLCELQDKVNEQEAELETAVAELESSRRLVEVMKEKATGVPTSILKQNIQSEEKVAKLHIQLKLTKAKAARRKELIERRRDLDLETIQSDDDILSNHSSEAESTKRSIKKVEKWKEGLEQKETKFTRVTFDASRFKVKKNPCDEDEIKTVSYDGDESEVNEAPRASKNNNASIGDFIDALNNFGARQAPQRVVVKGNMDNDLPKFGGEPEKWIEFAAEFNRTSEKYQFDDSENLVRLRKALVGIAKQTVTHLMSNVSNVPVIMETLTKRFGRPRMVLNALATKAKSCGNVSNNKPESIIEFGLAVEGLVSNIRAFNELGYMQNSELLEHLVRKLSPDLATRWYEWLADTNREDNLSSFSKWISKQLDIAYQRVEVKPQECNEEKSSHRRRQFGSFNATVGEGAKCICCDKDNHTLSSCFVFKKKSLDDKWKCVKKSDICICCLKPGHKVKDCDKSRTCKLDGCEKLHHRLLHGPGGKEKREEQQAAVAPRVEEIRDALQNTMLGSFSIIRGCDGPLPIVPVKLKGPDGTVKCHALLDTGASSTVMRKDIAAKLGLVGPTISYTYAGVTGGPETEKDAKVVGCSISGTIRGSKYYPLQRTVTLMDVWKNGPYSIDMDEIKKKWPYLKDVPASSLIEVLPAVIIGNNNPHLILAQKVVSCGIYTPMAWRSALGWAVTGVIPNVNTTHTNTISVLCGTGSMEELHNLVKQSFTFEDFGVRVSNKAGRNLEEKRAYEILERTTKKVDGFWETGLLWRSDEVMFPDNEKPALSRLIGTERKMKDPLYKKMYADKIQEYKDKKYTRKLTPAEKELRSSRTNIIPHFGLTNPNKPGKFRFIMDARAETDGVSLNSQLLKGPDLIRPLVGVLWNFRRHRIALTGDISDMFHRIRIRQEDQDSQRLLWREGDSRKEVDHYIMTVMIFGATSSPASAMFVKNKNASCFQAKYPEAAAVTVMDFYVDDVLSGGDTVNEVIKLRQQLTEIHEAGSFKLCKWMSNSTEVINSVPVELRADGVKDLADKDIPGERVLGMWWDPNEDVFQFNLGMHKVDPKILNGAIPTKRQMCGLIMSLFDPMGFIAHYKVKGLMLLQEVWRDGIGWDDEIEAVTFEKWKTWIASLGEIKKVKVPRCISRFVPEADNVELHTFVDASSQAFCAVSYLRIQKESSVEVALISAKVRVAPLKKSTIPKLELQAALLGARLANTIEEELRTKINKRFFWSDSTTVWFWLRSRAGKLPEFIANRVGEIQETTDVLEWNWVPTKINVADIGTRFETDISLAPDTVWFRGPAFLCEKHDSWNFEQEKGKSDESAVIAVFKEETRVKKESEIRSVLSPPERFSSYTRAVRASAAVVSAGRYWLGRVRERSYPPSAPWFICKLRNPVIKSDLSSRITLEDIFTAEKSLLKLAQEEAFGGGEAALKKNGQIWKLSPVMSEDGLIRVDGRIQAAKDISFATRSPIILPSNHPVTNLIVQFEHERNAHQGMETVLSNIREKFWLVSPRHTVRKCFYRCQLCKLRKARPFNPKMGPLPAVRLAANQPPFSCTGVDLFGPMEVTVGRHVEKRWGVLFFCMVTRGVHLEIVYSLAADDFIMGLSRFMDTRGRPKHISSDNGTNFVATSRILNELWLEIDMEKVKNMAEFQRIEWTFNPPAAPHMGGSWERLIQTVKKCLSVILHEKRPRDSTLLTAMKSIENILNSRPLTFQSSDVTDPGVITPNHILRGSSFDGPSIPMTEDLDENAVYREQWKRSLAIADQFWKQWTRFYLPKLLLREKWHEAQPDMELGSLVLMVDDNLPRNTWTRAFVSQAFPGKDNIIRNVEVTTSDFSSGRKTTFRRAVARLVPLGLKMKIKGSEDP